MMMIIIFLWSIFYVPSVEQKVGQDCPDGQVLHVDPDTKAAFCCIPVKLFKGQEFVRCLINGTHDSTRKCPEGLFQEDETFTDSEATCTSEPQCIVKENRRIDKCDEKGENCKPACVCNYRGGFCGTIYYDCRSFPNDCAKEYVQEDCSCNKPLANGSGADTTKTPSSDETSQKNSTISGPIVTFISTDEKPKINTKNDTVPTVGKKNNTLENDKSSRPGLEQEKSGFPVYSVGAVIGTVVIVIVIGFVVYYRVSLGEKLLCMYKKCRRCGDTDYTVVPPEEVVITRPKPQTVVTPEKPTAEVKPLVQGLSQEDNGVHSFYMHDESGDAQDAQNVDAQHMPSIYPQVNGINGAQAVALEEPISNDSSNFGIEALIDGCVTLSTISSPSFDSDNTVVKQIESDQNNDNTEVKLVEDTDQTERKELELNQHHSVDENPQSGTTALPSVESRFQSGSSGWSSFGSSINNSTSGQIVDHPCGDLDIQEVENEDEDSQGKEEIHS